MEKRIHIKSVRSAVEREELVRPFGFKGGYAHEIWQAVASIRSATGQVGVGLSTLSVLWSDATVFSSHSEEDGNALMFSILEHSLNRIKNTAYHNPIELLRNILDDAHAYGKKITHNPDMRLTFALNALVALDNAAWMLYARENGMNTFDEMIPPEYRDCFSCKQRRLACIPLMTYGTPLDEIVKTVEDGYFFLKIKIGCDPDSDGNMEKMLEGDKKRIGAIHRAIGGARTPHTKDGRIPYYFDANGRYESKERLMRLLDYTREIGAFDQIALLEEPFPEEYKVDVRDLGVRIAADESAHSDKDVEERIQMGYGAFALKPIAKTLSMTLKMLKRAKQAGVPCFCADLTVNPVLVDWNKNVAARLEPLPGMKMGFLETNGHQNYKRWDTLIGFHPFPDADWVRPRGGIFTLGDDFYGKSGGIFQTSGHYEGLVEN